MPWAGYALQMSEQATDDLAHHQVQFDRPECTAVGTGRGVIAGKNQQCSWVPAFGWALDYGRHPFDDLEPVLAGVAGDDNLLLLRHLLAISLGIQHHHGPGR